MYVDMNCRVGIVEFDVLGGSSDSWLDLKRGEAVVGQAHYQMKFHPRKLQRSSDSFYNK